MVDSLDFLFFYNYEKDWPLSQKTEKLLVYFKLITCGKYPSNAFYFGFEKIGSFKNLEPLSNSALRNET